MSLLRRFAFLACFVALILGPFLLMFFATQSMLIFFGIYALSGLLLGILRRHLAFDPIYVSVALTVLAIGLFVRLTSQIRINSMLDYELSGGLVIETLAVVCIGALVQQSAFHLTRPVSGQR